MYPRRYRPGKSVNIRCERRVILRMIGSVVTDDIDDRRPRATCVVEIGEPVGQARPQMQQGSGRLLSHATVAIRHSGYRTFEKTEHDSHSLDPVERRHEMHFRRAGIAETDFNARPDKRSQKTFRAVHVASPFV